MRFVEDLALLLGPRVAARSPLSRARAARDALVNRLAPPEFRGPPAVTAGYNIRTGKIAARACPLGPQCAEDLVVEALGGNKGRCDSRRR